VEWSKEEARRTKASMEPSEELTVTVTTRPWGKHPTCAVSVKLTGQDYTMGNGEMEA
jgi:hypothetical protein